MGGRSWLGAGTSCADSDWIARERAQRSRPGCGRRQLAGLEAARGGCSPPRRSRSVPDPRHGGRESECACTTAARSAAAHRVRQPQKSRVPASTPRRLWPSAALNPPGPPGCAQDRPFGWPQPAGYRRKENRRYPGRRLVRTSPTDAVLAMAHALHARHGPKGCDSCHTFSPDARAKKIISRAGISRATRNVCACGNLARFPHAHWFYRAKIGEKPRYLGRLQCACRLSLTERRVLVRAN